MLYKEELLKARARVIMATAFGLVHDSHSVSIGDGL